MNNLPGPNTAPSKKLLLHVCCAACAGHVCNVLSPQYNIQLFFYNPNIHPAAEYFWRLDEVKKLAALFNKPLIIGEYDFLSWFRLIKGYEKEKERGKRCQICFHIRFEKVFSHARQHHFDIVASTLSISPHKDTSQINAIAGQIAGKTGIPFLPENFKRQDGFKKASRQAREMRIRRQEYCGCAFSKADRIAWRRIKTP